MVETKANVVEVFKKPAVAEAAHGEDGIDNYVEAKYKYTQVGIKVNGETVRKKDVFSVFDLLAQFSGGLAVVKKPFYDQRVKRAERKMQRKAEKLRQK